MDGDWQLFLNDKGWIMGNQTISKFMKCIAAMLSNSNLSSSEQLRE